MAFGVAQFKSWASSICEQIRSLLHFKMGSLSSIENCARTNARESTLTRHYRVLFGVLLARNEVHQGCIGRTTLRLDCWQHTMQICLVVGQIKMSQLLLLTIIVITFSLLLILQFFHATFDYLHDGVLEKFRVLAFRAHVFINWWRGFTAKRY